jgi:HlyD family secretion protein
MKTTMLPTPRRRTPVVLRAAGSTALALACLDLAGCSKPAPAAKAADPVTVTVAQVQEKPISAALSANGLMIPELEAAVSTELNGYRVAKVFVDQDAMVKAGQPLARLDDTLLRAQIDQQKAVVAQQQVASERQAAEAQRVAGLDNQGVLPQEQIVERRLAARSGVAAVQAAQAQLNDLDTREGLMTVRAPVGGLVLERAVRPGDVASPTTALFRIAADDVIELNADVPEASLSAIHPGDTATVQLPDGETLTGRVRVVSPEVDQQTKLGHVRITLPRRPDLRNGGYGRAIFSGSQRLARVVPDSAVRYDADGASVLTLTADNHVKRVPVKTGARQSGVVELVDGPPTGVRVVLGGGAFVLDGDLVRPVPAPAP